MYLSLPCALRLVSDVSQLQGLQHCARPVAYAELRENARCMVLDRALGGAKRIRDLAIAVAAGHQAEDLDLALGQRVGRAQRIEVTPHVLEAPEHPLRD